MGKDSHTKNAIAFFPAAHDFYVDLDGLNAYRPRFLTLLPSDGPWSADDIKTDALKSEVREDLENDIKIQPIDFSRLPRGQPISYEYSESYATFYARVGDPAGSDRVIEGRALVGFQRPGSRSFC